MIDMRARACYSSVVIIKKTTARSVNRITLVKICLTFGIGGFCAILHESVLFGNNFENYYNFFALTRIERYQPDTSWTCHHYQQWRNFGSGRPLAKNASHDGTPRKSSQTSGLTLVRGAPSLKTLP